MPTIDINLILALFAGVILLLSLLSSLLQRVSLPGPLLALAVGVVVGPGVLGLIRIEDFGVPPARLLEEAARLTLAVGLAGVALRLPHGYWKRNRRWVLTSICLGMPLMFAIATGVLWALLGIPFLVALTLGAIITPTDPVVATPIVTGSLATKKVPANVRFNVSSESGLNDGLGYLFVLLPVLLLTSPDTAVQELLTKVLLWEILGAAAFGGILGYVLGKLFMLARSKGLMEETSYLVFLVPFALLVLGAGKLLGTDAVLAVFVAGAVFGQVISQKDEKQEDKIEDAVNRFFLLPIFIILGMALPLGEWFALGWGVPAVLLLAVLLRRALTLAILRPLLRRVHDVPQTVFLGWFGPVGVSALFYATLAERMTGNQEIFVYSTLAITLSVIVHGISTAPFSAWLHRREAARSS
ncbi:cation:proton antiporter [Arthrobacter agilis]|uniref:cation:proton antiporter domain-containing protein n=1 Tax=Arthrobacter agilis TaxID=37921 RepID=UPI0023673802|nr:cation:proton antiporter [Arthrobacter agilis]WDF33594.1 cation:proton antiporter [Arthrobacter agilis]